MPPLFSIITVTLNCAEAAVQTARSLREQHFSDYEYIVKDGGSTDGTVAALEGFGVTRLISAPDGGIYDAMNEALQLCRGQYVCFLNAGDIFIDQQVLADMAQAIRQHPGRSFFSGDLLTMEPHPLYGRGSRGKGRVVTFPDHYQRRQLFTESVCQQTWFVRRELYLDHPLDTSLRLNADHEFFLHWLTHRPDCYQHLSRVVVRYAAGGASERQRERLRAERRILMKRYFTLSERIGYTLWLRARQIGRVLKFALNPATR